MAKQEKEVERWVTVNGARVPIFKDGSVGGPKALRDKVKAKEGSKAQPAKAKAEKAEASTTKAEATKTNKSRFYTESQLQDEEFRKNALEEMKRYEKNWSAYSLKERRNISPNGVKELRERIKELENYDKQAKQTKEQKTISDNEDLKEKQIAKNKAEKEAVTELQMYGKKKNGFPYSKKDAEAAVKSMTPEQIKKLADKRDERRAYQEKLIASSDMQLKKQYKTATFDQQKEIQAEMHSRGYSFINGKWVDRYTKRGYKKTIGRRDDWD